MILQFLPKTLKFKNILLLAIFLDVPSKNIKNVS